MLRSRGAAGGWAEARAMGMWDLYARAARAMARGYEGQRLSWCGGAGWWLVLLGGGRVGLGGGGGDLKQPGRGRGRGRRRWLVAVVLQGGEK